MMMWKKYLPTVKTQPMSRHQLIHPFRKRIMFAVNLLTKFERVLEIYDRLQHVDLKQLTLVMDERPFFFDKKWGKKTKKL